MTARRNPEKLIGAFLEEGLTELPDRAFDAVRRDIHRTRQRIVIGPWKEPSMTTLTRLAIAAAIVLALGLVWVRFAPVADFGGPARTDPSIQPSPTPAPVAGNDRDLPTGRYFFDYGAIAEDEAFSGTMIEITIPAEGWTNFANFAVDKNYGPSDADAGASFVVWHIKALNEDPCTDHTPRATQPGPGIDELLEALADQAGLSAGPITDVTVDGFAGKFVELTVTADIADCPNGFYPWVNKYVQGNDEVLRVYALDVEGERLTFFLRIPARTTQADRAELEAVVASVDIQP